MRVCCVEGKKERRKERKGKERRKERKGKKERRKGRKEERKGRKEERKEIERKLFILFLFLSSILSIVDINNRYLYIVVLNT